MPTSPVTLDLSKAQPIPVTLDLSKAQPLPGSQPAKQGGFAQSFKDRLQSPFSSPLGQGGMVDTSNADIPMDQSMGSALKDAGAGIKDSLSHPSQLIPKWEDIKKAITPKEVDQIRAGDYSGALGTALVDFVNVLSGGGINPETAGAKVEGAANATVRGAAKTANTVIPQAGPVVGAGIGASLGHATGIPGMGAGLGVAGSLATKNLLKKVRVPGESFPLSDAEASAAKQAAEEAAAKEAADRAEFAANPNLTRIATKAERPNGPIHGESGLPKNSQAIPPQSQPTATAAPESAPAPWKIAANANDPAVIKQAQQSLVDAAVPPTGPTASLNKVTQAKVDFYVQKGDVPAAKKAIQDAVSKRSELLDDKSFQEMGREAVQADESNYWKTKNALRQAAENPAVGKGDMAVEQQAQAAAKQAYDATIQKNTPAFKRMGNPKSLAVELPADEDLTAILQKSVDAVNAKKAAKRTRP